jgi:nickel-dependent lactate racemase
MIYKTSLAPEQALNREVRTGVWHNEGPLSLHFPAEWDLVVLWPPTPPPLTDRDIAESLERPVGQPPIRELCRGKSRPLIIVDDLNRPTPVCRVMPVVLEHLRQAGIPPTAVRILLATGTHGAPRMDAVRRKLGPEAASRCRVSLHDSKRKAVFVGRTSFGTPVLVDEEVAASDFVMGIGGVYPNYTAGFGGGSKLALGVLAFRSIKHLHFGHPSARGRYDPGQDFRRDLNEIARMIRLNTMVSLQIDADREVIRATCGDHFSYYEDEVAFARQFLSAPMPDGADVVVSNAYPSDLSVTAILQKGIGPLLHAKPGASRIVIASCTEGAGYHGLIPVVNRTRMDRVRHIARRISVMTFRELAAAAALRLGRASREKRPQPQNPIWLYRPGDQLEDLPPIPGFRIASSWPQIVQAVEAEQGGKKRLKALLYPCAPLQRLE